MFCSVPTSPSSSFLIVEVTVDGLHDFRPRCKSALTLLAVVVFRLFAMVPNSRIVGLGMRAL